jgi:hypothetical protein
VVIKLIEGDFLRGPKGMWMNKDTLYIDRVHRLVSATVDAVCLCSLDIADELYPAEDAAQAGRTSPVSSHDGGAMRLKRRSPITRLAKYLVKKLDTLCGLLAKLSIVLTYGKKASIATQMQRQHGYHTAEQPRVDDVDNHGHATGHCWVRGTKPS